eukprot:2078646-Alexandrium_andersonii.AAC.1
MVAAWWPTPLASSPGYSPGGRLVGAWWPPGAAASWAVAPMLLHSLSGPRLGFNRAKARPRIAGLWPRAGLELNPAQTQVRLN